MDSKLGAHLIFWGSLFHRVSALLLKARSPYGIYPLEEDVIWLRVTNDRAGRVQTTPEDITVLNREVTGIPL